MFEFPGSKFTHEATLATAYACCIITIGLAAYSAIHVLSRVFYAFKIPDAGFGGGLCYWGKYYLKHSFGSAYGPGIGLAYSLAGIFNMIALMWMLKENRPLERMADSGIFCPNPFASTIMVWYVSILQIQCLL